jgi:hypothetical protein
VPSKFRPRLSATLDSTTTRHGSSSVRATSSIGLATIFGGSEVAIAMTTASCRHASLNTYSMHSCLGTATRERSSPRGSEQTAISSSLRRRSREYWRNAFREPRTSRRCTVCHRNRYSGVALACEIRDIEDTAPKDEFALMPPHNLIDKFKSATFRDLTLLVNKKW